MTDAVPYWRKPVPPIAGKSTVSSDTVAENSAVEPVAAVMQPEPTEPASPPDVMRPVNPLDILKLAANDLDLARVEARRCRTATAEARSVYSKALAAWAQSGPVMTQLDQARAFCATSQMERARKAARGILPYQPTITATARAMSGGNARGGRGGRAYVRGPDGIQAFTKAEALTLEANRLRAASAAAAAAAAAAKPGGPK